MTAAQDHFVLALVNQAIDALPESDQDAIRAGVALALALPHAVLELHAVIAGGGAKRGVGMGMDGQDAQTHCHKLVRHLARIDRPTTFDVRHRDAESGRLTLAHVASRAMLAIERGGK